MARRSRVRSQAPGKTDTGSYCCAKPRLSSTPITKCGAEGAAGVSQPSKEPRSSWGEPANNGWDTPAALASRTVRLEVFVDDPDRVIERAVAAGPTAASTRSAT